MTDKTRIPQARLSLSSFHVCFRFDGMKGKQFNRKLCLAKENFSHMEWCHDTKAWQLPIGELKSIYEFCREQFGVENVHFQCQQYKNNPTAVQLGLFEPMQN